MENLGLLRTLAIVGCCFGAFPAFIFSLQQKPVDPSADSALSALLQKAEAGDKQAQYAVAISYESGRGV